jgi:acetyl-CoA C-acetyltransferase
MEVLGRAAVRRLGRPVAEAEYVELYSCFPAAVRVQQRALGLEARSTPTITGGMAFAGGPFNNFVVQATVALANLLRSQPGSLGVVTTVSGLLTKPGIGAWSASPDGQPALLADLGEAAAVATGVVDVVETLGGYTGGATVATYTVTYEGMDPVRTVAVCDTDDGRRCVAVAADPELAAYAISTELIGSRVLLDGTGLVLR